MDKILRINMGAAGGPEIKTEPLGDYAGLGGRGMTSAIVAKEVPPTCHPLSADNKLVIAPGLLSGTIAAMSGRISHQRSQLRRTAIPDACQTGLCGDRA